MAGRDHRKDAKKHPKNPSTRQSASSKKNEHHRPYSPVSSKSRTLHELFTNPRSPPSNRRQNTTHSSSVDPSEFASYSSGSNSNLTMAQPQQFFALTTDQLQELIRATVPQNRESPRPKPNKTDLGGIPDYNGEPELLNQFLERCEELINYFYNAEEPESYDNKVLINNIRAKVKGKAALGICNNPLNSWAEIKEALVANFSDKRDEEHLILELGRMRQSQVESPFDFHARVYKIFSLLISKMKNSSTNQYTDATYKLMERTALRTFLMGLQEDIGRLLITKGPSNLNDAIAILTNEYQFPALRKKLLPQKSNQTNQNFNKNQQQRNWNNNKPSQQNNYRSPQQGPNNTPQNSFKNNQAYQNYNKKPQQGYNNNSQPGPSRPPQQKTDTPYIPYHLRNKDTMSYQTTLNHEVTDDPDEEGEEPQQDHPEQEEDFLDEDEEPIDST